MNVRVIGSPQIAKAVDVIAESRRVRGVLKQAAGIAFIAPAVGGALAGALLPVHGSQQRADHNRNIMEGVAFGLVAGVIGGAAAFTTLEYRLPFRYADRQFNRVIASFPQQIPASAGELRDTTLAMIERNRQRMRPGSPLRDGYDRNANFAELAQIDASVDLMHLLAESAPKPNTTLTW